MSLFTVIMAGACLGHSLSCSSDPHIAPGQTHNAPQPAATPEPTDTPSAAASSRILFEGQEYQANWDDGDTFSMPDPDGDGRWRVRLVGFNTLESYGPVHRWGQWSRDELERIAHKATLVAQNGTWHCERLKGSGGYGRILMDCPDLRQKLLSLGLAHLLSIDYESSEDDINIQLQAVNAGRGMWQKGAPKHIMTSVHSQDPNSNKKSGYYRLCNIKNGDSHIKKHRDIFNTCEEVCREDSCMLHVPYKNRYGKNKADCLKSRYSPPHQES